MRLNNNLMDIVKIGINNNACVVLILDQCIYNINIQYIYCTFELNTFIILIGIHNLYINLCVKYLNKNLHNPMKLIINI